MTIQEFAKSYHKLIAHQQDLLADMMGTMQDVYVPTESDIIKDLKNKDIDEIRENLLDLYHYYDNIYDPEDPDCATMLQKIEDLLEFLDNN